MQVNTTDMQLSNVVGGRQITELPLIGRVFTNLELILPGVQASSDRFTTAFSVNGSQTQQSAYVINGADTSGTLTATGSNSITTDREVSGSMRQVS